MKHTETIKEILLGIALAVMLPVITFWGISAFYPHKTNVSDTNIKKHDVYNSALAETGSFEKSENKSVNTEPKKKFTREAITFWVYLIVAVIAIVLGSFTEIPGLSIGLIGGGILNLLFSLSFSLFDINNPIFNFIIFITLFMTFVFVIVRKRRTDN